MAWSSASRKAGTPQVSEAIVSDRLLDHDSAQRNCILLDAFAARFSAPPFVSEWSGIALNEACLSRHQCLEGELNPHEPCGPTDFKSGASADSATQAELKTNYLESYYLFLNRLLRNLLGLHIDSECRQNRDCLTFVFYRKMGVSHCHGRGFMAHELHPRLEVHAILCQP